MALLNLNSWVTLRYSVVNLKPHPFCRHQATTAAWEKSCILKSSDYFEFIIKRCRNSMSRPVGNRYVLRPKYPSNVGYTWNNANVDAKPWRTTHQIAYSGYPRYSTLYQSASQVGGRVSERGDSRNQLDWEPAAHFGDWATLRNYLAQHEQNLSNVRFISTR